MLVEVLHLICITIKNRRREPGRDVKILSDRMLRIKGSAEHSRCTDLHALLNNFDRGFSAHRVYCCTKVCS